MTSAPWGDFTNSVRIRDLAVTNLNCPHCVIQGALSQTIILTLLLGLTTTEVPIHPEAVPSIPLGFKF